MKRLLLLLLLPILGLACTNKQSEVIRIGAVVPITGSHATQGLATLRGAQLAVAEINSVGGILGVPLELHDYDDASTSNIFFDQIKRLLKDDIDLLIGGISPDFLSSELISTLQKENAVMFVPSPVFNAEQLHVPELIPMHSSVDVHVPIIERFLSNYSSPKRAGVLVMDTGEGAAYKDLFSTYLEKNNHTIVTEFTTPVLFDIDSFVSTTLVEQGIEILLTALTPEQYATLVSNIKKQGLDIGILASNEVHVAHAKGLVFPEDIKGVAVFDFSAPERVFQEKFAAAYKERPTAYADTAYDTIYLIREILKANSLKDPQGFKDGLKNIQVYHGASGIFRFEDVNQPTNKESILKIFDGYRFREFVMGDTTL